jgi:hypothetical protein
MPVPNVSGSFPLIKQRYSKQLDGEQLLWEPIHRR